MLGCSTFRINLLHFTDGCLSLSEAFLCKLYLKSHWVALDLCVQLLVQPMLVTSILTITGLQVVRGVTWGSTNQKVGYRSRGTNGPINVQHEVTWPVNQIWVTTPFRKGPQPFRNHLVVALVLLHISPKCYKRERVPDPTGVGRPLHVSSLNERRVFWVGV